MRLQKREFPWCPIFLALGAIILHTAVLLGNLKLASKLSTVGSSSTGWAEVGYGIAVALNDTVEQKLFQASQHMTQTAVFIMAARTMIDDIVSTIAPSTTPVGNPDIVISDSSTSFASVSAQSQKSIQSQILGGIASPLPDIDSQIKKVKELKELLLDKLLVTMEPFLLQVQEWMVAYGDKVQKGIETFSLTLDMAQQILDKVMTKLKGPGANEDTMVFHTYKLFDVSNTGKINIQDVQDVAHIYSITVLDGESGKNIFDKYDADKDKKLSEAEFKLLSRDENLPGVLAVVLRAYAGRLLDAAGNVAGAKTRDEVARGVVQYMNIVCAKNLTKVLWVSQALTNGSMPLEFTSAILANLALAKENPAAATLTSKDVGATYVEHLMNANADYVSKAVTRMQEIDFWQNEGLDLKDQANCVKTVTNWVTKATKATAVLPELMATFGVHSGADSDCSGRKQKVSDDVPATIPSHDGSASEAADVLADDDHSTFLQCDAAVAPDGDNTNFVQAHFRLLQSKMNSGDDAENVQGAAKVDLKMQLPGLAWQHVDKKHRQHRRSNMARQAQKTAEQHAALVMLEAFAPATMSRATVRRALSSADKDPDAERVVKAGVPAHPSTLRFAEYLSNNATRTASELQHECFEYTGQANGPVENAASGITGMVKAIEGVVDLVKQYATPAAVKNLEKTIKKFALVLEEEVLKHLKEVNDASKASLIETNASKVDPESSTTVKDMAGLAGSPKAIQMAIAKAIQTVIAEWLTFKPLLDKFMSMLPTVDEYMKVARKQVSILSQAWKTRFAMIKMQSGPIFEKGAALQRAIWVSYFLVFVTFTLALPTYALWTAGYLGPNGASEEETLEGYQSPNSFRERCGACLACCSSCLYGCHNRYEGFWSIILLLEVIWLPMLIASSLFSTIYALQGFIAMGCSPIYILSDELICNEGLKTIATWLSSFDWLHVDISGACHSKQLLLCAVIHHGNSMFLTFSVVGSFLAAFMCLQLILDASARWERLHYLRLLREAGVDKEL